MVGVQIKMSKMELRNSNGGVQWYYVLSRKIFTCIHPDYRRLDPDITPRCETEAINDTLEAHGL